MLKVGHPCSHVCVCNPMLMGKQSLTQSCNKYKALKKKNNITNNINKSHHKTHLEKSFFTKKVNMKIFVVLKYSFRYAWCVLFFFLSKNQKHMVWYMCLIERKYVKLYFLFSMVDPHVPIQKTWIYIFFLFVHLRLC